MKYPPLLDEFVLSARQCFSKTLTGVYLHGSLALNSFNPEKSDIDLILITETAPSDAQKRAFMDRAVRLNERAPAKGLEFSVVERRYANPFVYPTPFELHFSPMHLRRYREDTDGYIRDMKGTDIDLAAHFTVITHAGIALYGAPVAEVFGTVPRAAYLDSILSDVENAAADIGSDPIYYTLNLCRVLAFVRDGPCLSKADGARWALRHLPEEWHPVISEAFACYTSNQTMHASTEALARFADFMLHLIGEANPQPSALC